MKKIYSLILAGAALIAAASCSKEMEQTPEVSLNQTMLTVTGIRPQLDVDTKTAWDGNTIVWSTGDKIRVGFTFDDEWMTMQDKVRFYASGEVAIDADDNSIGTFSVPTDFENPGEGEYVFYGIYPSSLMSNAVASQAPVLAISVPATQTPAATSFDAKADVMVGASTAETLQAFPEAIEINWTRVAAHADITFSNMAFDGTETISKISLTANEGAALAGSFNVNVTDGTFEADNATNELVLNGDKLTAGANSVEVWAALMPETITALDVTIQTDKAVYTRSISGINLTFKQNARNKLTINMSTATRTEDAAAQYSLFTGEIEEGDYLIYYDGKAMKAEVASNRLQYAEVTPSDDVIETNNSAIVWHIAPASDGYWTIYSAAEEMYAAATGTKNQATLSADGTVDKSLWSVSMSSGAFEFVNKNNAANNVNANLRNNGTYGFACYGTTTGGALSLYRKGAAPGISFETPSYTFTLGTEEYEAFSGQALINPNGLEVTYSSSNEDLASVSSDGTVTFVEGATGDVTITATFAGNDSYFSGVASYTISVKSGDTPVDNHGKVAEDPLTIEEALAIIEETGTTATADTYFVKGIVTKITEISPSFGNATYVISEDLYTSDGITVYRGKNLGNENFTSEDELTIGDEVVVTGTLVNYQGNTPEIPQQGNYIVSIKRAATLALASTSVKLMVGDTFDLAAETNGGTISYATNNEAVATVSAGIITAVSVGVATITVSVAATDELPATYKTVAVEVTAAGTKTVWVRKDISALADGDLAVIVATTSDGTYALSNNNGTSAAPSATSVTISNDQLASDPATILQWTVKVSNDSYQFFSGTNALYCTATNNGVRVGTNDNNAFTLDQDYLKNTATSRYVGVYNKQDWRCYTSINNNIKDQTFAAYVKTTVSE